MWICPKCNAENNPKIRKCIVCSFEKPAEFFSKESIVFLKDKLKKHEEEYAEKSKHYLLLEEENKKLQKKISEYVDKITTLSLAKESEILKEEKIKELKLALQDNLLTISTMKIELDTNDTKINFYYSKIRKLEKELLETNDNFQKIKNELIKSNHDIQIYKNETDSINKKIKNLKKYYIIYTSILFVLITLFIVFLMLHNQKNERLNLKDEPEIKKIHKGNQPINGTTSIDPIKTKPEELKPTISIEKNQLEKQLNEIGLNKYTYEKSQSIGNQIQNLCSSNFTILDNGIPFQGSITEFIKAIHLQKYKITISNLTINNGKIELIELETKHN